MKDIFYKICFKIYLVLDQLQYRGILKCKSLHSKAIRHHVYIKAFSFFPDNLLADNANIAFVIGNKLLGLPNSNDNHINQNQVQGLYKEIKSEEWIKKAVSDYFLLEAFYYSTPETYSFKEKSDNALKKARLYLNSAKPITDKDIGIINKNIKLEMKRLFNQARKLYSERVKEEKKKIIKPFTIKPYHIIFAASCCSILLLVSGFLYNKIFFSHFDIAVRDFFIVADYIATSIDYIIHILVISIVGVIGCLLGMNNALSRNIGDEQFAIKSRNRTLNDYITYSLVVISFIGVVYYFYGESAYNGNARLLLFPLVVLFHFAIELSQRLSIWSYIKNRSAVLMVLILIGLFSIDLITTIYQNIHDIESDDYIGLYTLELGGKYEKFLDNEFISANSSYIFLWDKKSRKINVIPKSGVISFHGKDNG